MWCSTSTLWPARRRASSLPSWQTGRPCALWRPGTSIPCSTTLSATPWRQCASWTTRTKGSLACPSNRQERPWKLRSSTSLTAACRELGIPPKRTATSTDSVQSLCAISLSSMAVSYRFSSAKIFITSIFPFRSPQHGLLLNLRNHFSMYAIPLSLLPCYLIG